MSAKAYLYLWVLFILTVWGQGQDQQVQYWQHQFDNMYKNLYCPRAQVLGIGNFDPRDHLSEYRNGSQVLGYIRTNLPKTREQRYLRPVGGFSPDLYQPLLEIMLGIDVSTRRGWELFYNSTIWFSQRSNIIEFTRIMEIVWSHKFYGVFTSPPLSQLYPQTFTPKGIVREANGRVDDTFETLFVSEESVVRYWREDPELNSFHGWWHMSFPYFWKPEIYGSNIPRKGEALLYMHHQLMNRYKAERLSNFITGDVQPLRLNPPFVYPEGYNPLGLDVDQNQYPARVPNTQFRMATEFENVTLEDMQIWQQRVLQALRDGYMIAINGTRIYIAGPTFEDTIRGRDAVGAAVEPSWTSPNLNYYGMIHNLLHDATGWLPSPYPVIGLRNGPIAAPETAMMDPAFYHIHAYVDTLLRMLQNKSGPRRRDDISYPGVMLTSIVISTQGQSWNISEPTAGTTVPGVSLPTPILMTYVEDKSFDITNAIQDCSRVANGQTYTIPWRLINYHIFQTTFTVYNFKYYEEDAGIRVFISPKFQSNGQPYSSGDLMWNMIELDHIPVRLRPGWNQISRSSVYNMVTAPMQGSQHGRLRRSCGFPTHLYLPKGNVFGLPFVMFVMIAPAAQTGIPLTVNNERYYTGLGMCQTPVFPYPDDRPMGYPFDRPVDLGTQSQILTTPYLDTSFWFFDIMIRHLENVIGTTGVSGSGTNTVVNVNVTVDNDKGPNSEDYNYYYDE